MDIYKQTITLLQDYLSSLGFQAQIHFELEGCYTNKQSNNKHSLDLISINQALKNLNIDGEVVNEYWRNQWEFVSLFNGQAPLKEADNLSQAIAVLPYIFSQYGINETLIQPVVWSGDQGKLAFGAKEIFSNDTRAVHIPNAVQINVSVLNSAGENIIAKHAFGEYLQQCFLQTSKACSLLYLPEEDAFERLKLKSTYGLAAELCSPSDISGGHQGSIALYKRKGKHNQAMGAEPVLYDHNHNVLLSNDNWQKTARIEHRLGASSLLYNPYINVLFALANVVDAINTYQQHLCQSSLLSSIKPEALPSSLYTVNGQFGAIDLFAQDLWLSHCINQVQERSLRLGFIKALDYPSKLGDKIKEQYLKNYQGDRLITF